MSSRAAIEACRLATTLLVRGEIDRAEDVIGAALAARPDDPNLLHVAGNCALARNSDAEALARYERSVAIAPDFTSSLLNLGFLYRKLHRLADARIVLRRCVSLAPATAAAWLNLTSTYVNEGEPDVGEMVAREAIARCPSSPDIRWNLGLLLLEQGKWREGWQEYRHRFDTAVLTAPTYAPDGNGPRRLFSIDELRAGQTVVCHGEQGLGDEILFAGMLAEFVADVQARGAEPVLDCNPRLRGIFDRNFRIETRPIADAGALAAHPKPIDWVVPIGDLAGLYRNADIDFPHRAGYLTADPHRVAAMRGVLSGRAGSRLVVGLAWTGGSPKTHSLYRTIPLVDWLPVLLQDACFVSLEYHDCQPELQRVAAERGIDVVSVPELTQASDYARTFEVVSALDLVITVPTSVLHVAGAVGTPCWVVMHHKAAWRECSRDRTIPWYPRTHRRFVRGPGAFDWGGTLSEVASALQSLPARGL